MSAQPPNDLLRTPTEGQDMTRVLFPGARPAPTSLTVEMPVKPAIRSREAWLFGLSGVLAAILGAVADVPPEMLAVVPWAPAVIKLMIGVSAVLGLLARLSRPDIASGVPWLDRSNPKAGA